MRKILYRESIGNDRYSDFIHEAVFHQWVVKPRINFDSKTYAIVEIKNGFMREIPMRDIKFVNTEAKV